MNLETILDSYSGDSALWGPFSLLLACGMGFPVPEDIVLLAAGFLGAENGLPLFRVIAIMYVGILLGDGIVYSLGRFFGRGIIKTKIGRYLIKEASLVRAEDAFKKYGRGVIFVGRFLPGLRAPIFFSAGALRYQFLRFFIMDALAALVSAPLFVWVGHWAAETYAEDLSALQSTLGRTKIFMGALILVLAMGIIFYWRKKHQKAKKLLSSPQDLT